ncbi:hypothetical protein ACFL0F_02460 [Patescibacteria group bacterium]
MNKENNIENRVRVDVEHEETWFPLERIIEILKEEHPNEDITISELESLIFTRVEGLETNELLQRLDETEEKLIQWDENLKRRESDLTVREENLGRYLQLVFEYVLGKRWLDMGTKDRTALRQLSMEISHDPAYVRKDVYKKIG